jgi:hypothetical protein
MHPLIYSSKLTETPKDLARFRLRPGDDLAVALHDDHLTMMARPRTWASRFTGAALRPVGRVAADHAARLRPLVEEGRHMRIRVVGIEGFIDRPEGVSFSVWVEGLGVPGPASAGSAPDKP